MGAWGSLGPERVGRNPPSLKLWRVNLLAQIQAGERTRP